MAFYTKLFFGYLSVSIEPSIGVLEGLEIFKRGKSEVGEKVGKKIK